VLEEPKLLAFIVDNFRLMAMGKINAHELEGVLEQELEAIHDRAATGEVAWQDRRAMPGFGILAAVLGIVMAMNTVAEARRGEIAEHVGAAMVGTFIGIFFCYGLLDPMCNMMKQLVGEEARPWNASRWCWSPTWPASRRCWPSTPAAAWCSSTSSRASPSWKAGSMRWKMAARQEQGQGREAVVLKPHDKHEQTIVKRGGGKHDDDDHGGAWKVAFADFCLALMCCSSCCG
jgi:hypothetical protein